MVEVAQSYEMVRNFKAFVVFALKKLEALLILVEKFDKLNKHQQKAIELFINQKRDIVVNLPTGYGKSIIYQLCH